MTGLTEETGLPFILVLLSVSLSSFLGFVCAFCETSESTMIFAIFVLWEFAVRFQLVPVSFRTFFLGCLQRGNGIAGDPCFRFQKSAEFFEWRVFGLSCVVRIINFGWAQSFSALTLFSFFFNPVVYNAAPS